MMKHKSVSDRPDDETGYLLSPGEEAASATEKTPGTPKQFTDLEERLLQLTKSRSARIALPTFEGLQMISVEDIVKCIAHESYTEIVLICGTKFMVSRHLKEYEFMLGAYNFFRIHNSCLINLRHVKKYIRGEGGYVLMADGHSCEVSRRKKQDLLNRLSIVEF
jgi:two-component system, LytTR family, response regulator